MRQLLLIPDPRPLVERLGADFFRELPDRPGVYLMRDAAEGVLYVGKARSLRKRLTSYRVANPDRMPRRHLRMLRAVARVELHECSDEAAALDTEAKLLLALRPKFNRAGVWAGPERFLAWRTNADGFDLDVTTSPEPGWESRGSLGAGAIHLRAAILRLFWCVAHPDRNLGDLPQGWFRGRGRGLLTIARRDAREAAIEQFGPGLAGFFDGQTAEFLDWLREGTAGRTHPFEIASRDADLEVVELFMPVESSTSPAS